MPAVSDFLSQTVVLAAFVSGLAFFTLGLASLFAFHRPGELGLTCHLRWLAAFGLLHSLAGWLDLPLFVPGRLGAAVLLFQPLRILFFALSAAALVHFGVLALGWTEQRRGWLRWTGPGLLVAWAIVAWQAGLHPQSDRPDPWLTADLWARYLLGLPGAMLAATALLAQRRRLVAAGQADQAGNLGWGAVAFVGYGLAAGLIVPAGSFLPASTLNTRSFYAATGVPVQFIHAALAVSLAVFGIRLMWTLNAARRQTLDRCVSERALAQQTAQEAAHRLSLTTAEWDRQVEAAVARRTRALEQRNRELVALSAVALTVSQPAGLNDMLSNVLPQVINALELDAGGVLLRRHGAQPSFSLVAQLGLPADTPCLRAPIPAGDPVCAVCHLALLPSPSPLPPPSPPPTGGRGGGEGSGGRWEQPYFRERCPRVGWSMAGAPVEPHGHLVIPLTARGQVMGCVCLLTWPGYVFDPARVELLEAISHQLSVAVANACLYEQIQHMAVLEERERISREMHDGLAQVLGYLNLKSQAAQAALRSGQVKHAAMAVREIEHVAQAAYAEIREAILGLRTVVSPGTDLFVSLTEYVHHFKREWGIDVRLIVPAGVTLTFAPNAEVQLLRIIQEALANVRKHAQAKQAWVRFEVDGDAAVVTIEDDGIGFDPVRVGPGRFGLAMMGERAESVGGTFELETAPGAGTRVIVRLPLNPVLVE